MNLLVTELARAARQAVQTGGDVEKALVHVLAAAGDTAVAWMADFGDGFICLSHRKKDGEGWIEEGKSVVTPLTYLVCPDGSQGDPANQVLTLKRQLAAAKRVIQSKEEMQVFLTREVERLRSFEATVDSEREANARLTEEIAQLQEQVRLLSRPALVEKGAGS